MKRVVVSQRVDNYPKRNETRDALDQELISFLLVAGFLPVPIPNVLHKVMPNGHHEYEILDEWLSQVKPSALILSGGNDIGESSLRDSTEERMLEYAKRQRLPVLGICRGMQMIAHLAGAKLRRVEGHVRTTHQIAGEFKAEVNSFHTFSIDDCPQGYRVLAISEDGEIEAIRHRSLPWEGWMWHPERNKHFDSRDLTQISELFSEESS